MYGPVPRPLKGSVSYSVLAPMRFGTNQLMKVIIARSGMNGVEERVTYDAFRMASYAA